MPSITTANLFSHETVQRLLVEPLFARSTVLPYLKRLQTRATTYYLPKVTSGTANWTDELENIAPAGVGAAEIAVTPKKCAALEIVSNESRYDAGAAGLIGDALVDSMVKTVDSSFVNGGGTGGPLGLPGLTGTSSVDGSPADFDSWADAISAISVAGGQATVLFLSPADWNTLVKMPATTGGNVPALAPSTGASGKPVSSLYGVEVSVVPSLAAGTGWAVDGNRTVVVVNSEASVDMNEGPTFDIDGVMVRAKMRLEFASIYPASVCKVNDVP